ncbi:MAG: carbonic anhydrase [Dissulfurispiraceae bacterium]
MERTYKIILAVVASLVITGLVYSFVGSGNEAQQALMEGNKRFVTGDLSTKDIGGSRRQELTKGQHPFATVLACSDSRVAPEIIFDQGLGDIFVVRVAGNVVEPTTLGSIEYGVEHLHTPLLVILGHQQCGAVKAALEATREPEGNIGAILKKILPAVEAAKKTGKGKDKILELAIKENIKNTYNDIMKSRIVSELVHEGKVKVIAAEYMLSTGKVELIDMGVSGNAHKH